MFHQAVIALIPVLRPTLLARGATSTAQRDTISLGRARCVVAVAADGLSHSQHAGVSSPPGTIVVELTLCDPTSS